MATVAMLVELGYILLANVALAAGAVESLAESDSAVKAGYRLAWTIWPGIVHVEDFRMTMQDRNVQFVLDIPRADVHVRLREVLHRTFHATRVRGEGVVFRFRERIEPEAAGRRYVRELPPIPGFPDPPLRDNRPRSPYLDDAHYNFWTVHLEDVDVGVREIWMDMLRYQGEARATGAFRLRPARRVWVGPAALTVKSGNITSGPRDFLRTVTGTVDCRVDDFDVRPDYGVGVFRFISARVRLGGQVAGLEPMDFLWEPSSGYSLQDGSGTIDADLRVDHGVFTPDTRFTFRTRHLGAQLAGIRLHLDGEIAIFAHGPSRGLHGRLGASIPNALLTLEGARYPPPRLENVEASVSSTTVDLKEHWSLQEGQLQMGEVTLTDLRWLNDLPVARPPSWSVEGGEGSARGALTLSHDLETGGWATLHIEHGVARGGGIEIHANADAEGTVSASPRGLLRSDLRIEAQEIRLDQIGIGVCPLGRLQSASITARIARTEERRMTRELRATLRDGSLRWGDLDVAVERTTLQGQYNPGWMQARIDAEGLQLKNAGGAPRSWQAKVPSTSVDVVLSTDGGKTGGSVRVEAKRAEGQVGKTKMRGDIIAQLAMVTPGNAGTADVSGTVLVRDVNLTKGAQRIDGWWAQVDLQRASLDTSLNFDLSAEAEVRVQNGLPVLYLLTPENESPSWLVSQLARTTLTVGLDIRRFCRWTDVEIPLIEGGLLWAQGRVQTEPGQTYGAMLFRLAPLKLVSVGFAFYEDYSNSSLLVGPGWLEDQVLPMSRAATMKREAGCQPQPPRCQ